MSRRKKPSEKSSPEFTHAPFGVLKGLANASHSPQKPKFTAAEGTTFTSEDEETLFLQAMAGVRRRDANEGLQRGKRPVPHDGTRQEEEDRELFLRAVRDVSKTSIVTRKTDAQDRRSIPGRRKRIKRGALSVAAELDLHGCRRDEALFRLDHFLSSSAAKGLSAVLVITGKGMNSPEGPVLQRAVARWLREGGREMIAEFGPAPREKGGSGAFVVFLKKRS